MVSTVCALCGPAAASQRAAHTSSVGKDELGSFYAFSYLLPRSDLAFESQRLYLVMRQKHLWDTSPSSLEVYRQGHKGKFGTP